MLAGALEGISILIVSWLAVDVRGALTSLAAARDGQSRPVTAMKMMMSRINPPSEIPMRGPPA